jgi:hypothetical protein
MFTALILARFSPRETERLHRSFVGRPSLCEGLRFLRMTAGGVVSVTSEVPRLGHDPSTELFCCVHCQERNE